VVVTKEEKRIYDAAYRLRNQERIQKRQLEHSRANPEMYREWKERYKAAHPERRAATVRLNKYGITAEQYNALVEKQHGACAICSLPCSSGRRLSVDHDHRSGKIRGLLCVNCNQSIGKFKDNPALLDRAAAYLEKNA